MEMIFFDDALNSEEDKYLLIYLSQKFEVYYKSVFSKIETF